MLQNPCKTLGFKKNMVYKIPPGGEVNHIQPVAYKVSPKKTVLDVIASLTLCIRETPKRVLLQTVKTQMKCSISSIMLHFIRVYNVCKGKKRSSDKIQYF